MRRYIRPEKAKVETGDPEGQYLDARGYYRFKDTGGLVHREIWRRHYGEPPEGWVVHHIDCWRKNNQLDNLVALPEGYHNQIHAWGRDGTGMPPKQALLDFYHRVAPDVRRMQARLTEVNRERQELLTQLRALECRGVKHLKRRKGA